MAPNSGDDQSFVLGRRLRERVSSIVKTAALANGVLDTRIDARRLRAGGDTALYTQWSTFGR